MATGIGGGNDGVDYGVEVFTGIRPTGDLTVANHLGSVNEIVALQENFRPVVFVADVHALTDQDPETVAKHRLEVVKDYLALGVDPEGASIFMQSDLLGELSAMTLLLSRELTLSELTGVPTLKDKLGDDENQLSARVFLGMYPVLMASDILAQRAQFVPVGRDQIAHIELTRRLAEKFNTRNGATFPMPEAYVADEGEGPLTVLSLRGKGKMSKSKPEGALFLADSPDVVRDKVNRAQTGFPGEVTPHIESLAQIAKGLSDDEATHQKVDDLVAEHAVGEAVMGKFKGVVTDVVNDFLEGYHDRKQSIASDPHFITDVLAEGRRPAQQRARATLEAMRAKLNI
jgi:tryptophanyl-tRNA synthetase